MNREQMVENLHRGICNVVFEKKDGSVRNMNCTLHPDRLPARQTLNEVESATAPQNQSNIRVFDTDLQEWRSFRVESVQSFGTPTFLTEA